MQTSQPNTTTTLQYNIVKSKLLSKEFHIQNRYDDTLYSFQCLKGANFQLTSAKGPLVKSRSGKWQFNNRYLEIRGFPAVVSFQMDAHLDQFTIDICPLKGDMRTRWIWKWLDRQGCYVLTSLDDPTPIAKVKPASRFERGSATLEIDRAIDDISVDDPAKFVILSTGTMIFTQMNAPKRRLSNGGVTWFLPSLIKNLL